MLLLPVVLAHGKASVPVLRAAAQHNGTFTVTSADEGPGNDQWDHSNALVQTLIDQVANLQQSSAAEQARLRQAQQNDREVFLRSISEITAKVDAMSRRSIHSQSALQPGANRALEGVHEEPAVPSTSSLAQHPTIDQERPQCAPRDTSAPPPRVSIVGTHDNLFPEGQPSFQGITLKVLADATHPTKSLRHDEQTASVADEIMRAVGILDDTPGTKKHKSKFGRKKLAKWPSDYAFRMHDDEPFYDSLSAPEWVAGSMSIIEDGQQRLHFCSFCFATGKRHTHPLVNCRKHKDSLRAKNSKGGRPPKQD